MKQTTFKEVPNGVFFTFDEDEDDDYGYVKLNKFGFLYRIDDDNLTQLYWTYVWGEKADAPVTTYNDVEEYIQHHPKDDKLWLRQLILK